MRLPATSLEEAVSTTTKIWLIGVGCGAVAALATYGALVYVNYHLDRLE